MALKIQGTTVVGYGAGDISTNIAIGGNALATNTTGVNNTAVGSYALYYTTSGTYNTAVGASALQTNTIARYNTAVGYQALFDNSTGENNTAIGYIALGNCSTGINNVAVGASSLAANTAGSNNVAIGFTASYSGTASSCVAIGYQSLYGNNGDNNTSIGYDALTANTTGANNTAVGFQAGNSITIGTNNLILGYDANASSATVSNEITLGDANITRLRIPGINLDTDDATDGQIIEWDTTTGGFLWVANDAGGGDMLAATYDPTNIIGDVFDTDNHVSGTINKVYTAGEQTKLSNISGTNTGDQTSIVGITGTIAQFNTAITDAAIQPYDVDTAKTDVAQSFSAQQYATEATLTDGASIAWNLNAAQEAKVTLAGNRAMANPTNQHAGAWYHLRVIQDATGTRTLTYGTSYKFGTAGAPTLTTTANGEDVLAFRSNGTYLQYMGAAIGVHA